jgi:hypothetical protein
MRSVLFPYKAERSLLRQYPENSASALSDVPKIKVDLNSAPQSIATHPEGI